VLGLVELVPLERRKGRKLEITWIVVLVSQRNAISYWFIALFSKFDRGEADTLSRKQKIFFKSD